MKISATELEPK